MPDAIADRLQKIASLSTLRLTHRGRKTGTPYQVTIWFIVDGNKILLPSANIDRQWVRNVRKTPAVEMQIGAEKFTGTARFLDEQESGSRLRPKVTQKYWIATPMMAVAQFFAAFGLGKVNFGGFEVTLSN